MESFKAAFSDDDETFPAMIYAAEWVKCPDEIHFAQTEYQSLLNKYRQEKISKHKLILDVVPYRIKIRAVQHLISDPVFKKFWIAGGAYDGTPVLSTYLGLFTRYLGDKEENFRPIFPQISQAERDKALSEAGELIKKFCGVVYSDASLETCVMVAFRDAIKAAGLNITGQWWVEGKFWNSFYQDLSGQTENGCRRMQTHAGLPRSLKEGIKAKRGDFIFKISNFVKWRYGRYNHAAAARILEKIRPDLGSFSAEDVRQYMMKRKIA